MIYNIAIKLFIFISFLFIVNSTASGQCCAPGNPASGSEHTGTLPKKSLRTITYFRHSFSDTYYKETEKADYQGSIAGYDFIGEVLSYGLTKRFAGELELGYYFDKYQDSEVLARFTTHGLNNAVVSFKYAVLKSAKGMEFTIGSGLKIPLSDKVFKDEYNIPFPQEIQPSTGAFGYVGQLYFLKTLGHKWRTVLTARYEINGYNKDKYRFGDSFITSLFIGRSITSNLSAVIQVRNEIRKQDYQDKTRYIVTGGNIMFVSPQISYTFPHKITASIMSDIPVYRNYNGTQLSPRYAFGISILKDFCL